MKACTQNNRILAALKRGDKLTPLDALRRFSCFRLGARVYDLKERGYKIAKRMVKRGDARVAEYRLG